MQWQLDHSDRLQGYQDYIDATGEIPDDLRDAPQPTPENQRVIRIFGQLRQLADLGIGGEILRIHGADATDIASLAEIAHLAGRYGAGNGN